MKIRLFAVHHCRRKPSFLADSLLFPLPAYPLSSASMPAIMSFRFLPILVFLSAVSNIIHAAPVIPPSSLEPVFSPPLIPVSASAVWDTPGIPQNGYLVPIIDDPSLDAVRNSQQFLRNFQ